MTAAKKRRTAGFSAALIAAGELHVGHIGEMIRWMEYDDRNEVTILRTAELRQVAHGVVCTTIYYGVGAEGQTNLEHLHPIILAPPGDYTDWRMFVLPEVPPGQHHLT